MSTNSTKMHLLRKSFIIAIVVLLNFSAFSNALASSNLVVVAASTKPTTDQLTPQKTLSVPGTEIAKTDSAQVLTVTVGLKPLDQTALDTFLHDLYDPTSPVYHQYITPAEFTSRFISSADRAAVTDYINSKGFKVSDSGVGSLLTFSGTVGQLEQAFNVTLSNFKDSQGRVFYSNKQTPALPESISNKINGLLGLDNSAQIISHIKPMPAPNQPAATSKSIKPTSGSGCSGATALSAYGAFTPNQLKTAYNFDGLISQGYSGSGQTVALFELDDYSDTNISTYKTCFSLSNTVTRKAVSGGVSTLGTGENEVELDIEVVAGMATSSSILVYEAPSSGYYTEYQTIANDNLARTISSSWSTCEAALSSSSKNTENTIFQQMATQGQTMFVAAGDDGSEGCVRVSGSTALAVGDTVGQPYVTAVGGTKLSINSSSNAYTSEVTWNDYSGGGAGGGGISTYWAKPYWQTGTGTSNTYSNGNRQVPDVSAVASSNSGYSVYVHEGSYCAALYGSGTDCWYPIGGTSAAAPLWAAGAAIMNGWMVATTSSNLGFINPALYNILNNASSTFHDITSGDNCYNASCGTPDSGTGTYPATTGYDQATGLGTFNLNSLALALKKTTIVSLSTSATPSTYGQTVTFTAHASPNAGTTTMTGSVTFKDGTTTLGTGTLNGSGIATYSTTALSLGSHTITAVFSSTNANYYGNTSSSLSQTVNQASSTTAVASSANPSTYNQSVTFTATVSSTGGTPSGTVTFKDSTTTLGTGTLNGSGVATYSTAALSVGTHSITAVYGGDTNFTTSTSSTLSQVVNTASTTTTVASSVNPSAVNQSVTFTATVSSTGGTPSGTVTFKDNTTTLGTGTLNGSGVATYSTSTLAVGTHPITAVYGGATNFATSTSSSLSQVVNQNTSAISLTSALNPSTYGQSVTFTATVTSSGGTPSGTVTFKDGATTLGTGTLNGSGVATYATSTLTVGIHSITAVYGGDTNFATSTSSTLSQVVNQATSATGLVSSLNPSTFGQSITFTATVTSSGGTPSGTVTFKDGAATLGTGTLNGSGVATYSTTALSVATHSITAVYGGDTNFATSTSSILSQVVNKTSSTTTVTSSLNPSTFGQSVTFTATVSSTGGTPSGTVTFKDGAATLGASTLNGSGIATYSTTTLSAGTHSITAVYGGDTNFTTSTSSTLSQVVNQIIATTNLTSSVNPSTLGQSVTFTATVGGTGGTPSGTVTFKDGATTLGTGTLDGSGVATYSTATLSVGTHSITGVYSGDTNYATNTSSTLSQVVSQLTTATSLASSLDPSVFGQSVTFTATVTSGTGIPDGSVTFKDGTTTLGTGTLDASGIATYTTSTLAFGTRSMTAVYGGSTNYSTSTSSTFNQVVIGDTTTSVTAAPNPSSLGQSVTFTATVSSINGTPPGTVNFWDNGAPLSNGTLNGSGIATFTTSSLSVGIHQITAMYMGTPRYNSSTSAVLNQVVNLVSTTTGLVSSPNPSSIGQTVTFTATIAPVAATGTVTFTEGATVLGTVSLTNGTAVYTTASLSSGNHVITAIYGGDSTYAGSSSPAITQVVGTTSTSLDLVSSTNPSLVGQSVTFTATVSPPAATGMVTFTVDSGSGVGVAVSGGLATYTTSTLTAGSHVISATYGGDSNYASSANSLIQQVNLNSAALSLTSNPNPSTYGQGVILTATISPATATGLITFTDGVNVIGASAINNGRAIYIVSSLVTGTHTLMATYAGNVTYAGTSSSSVTQVVNAACAPLVVTVVTDDGTGTTCGTLSYALAQPWSNTTPITVTFALTQGNTITFTGSLTTTAKVKAYVTVSGGTFGTTSRIILNGNGVSGNGLDLLGHNYLVNLTIENFGGKELVMEGTGNRFQGVVVIAS